jgi:hypothetical protein
MSPPLEVTIAPCVAVHCSIATKMASVKRVTDEPAFHITGSGANVLCFKTRQVSVTHSVYSSHEKETERRRGMSKAEITRERKTVSRLEDWKKISARPSPKGMLESVWSFGKGRRKG